MAMHQVFIVQQRDFADASDEKGELSNVDVYATLESANAAAKAHFIDLLGLRGGEMMTDSIMPGSKFYPEFVMTHAKDRTFLGECKPQKDNLGGFKVEVNSMAVKTKAVAPEHGQDESAAHARPQTDGADDEEEDETPAPAKKKSAPAKKVTPKKKTTAKKGTAKKTPAPKERDDGDEKPRKKIPEGLPNALEGLKLLFTGTFNDMDRETSIATAAKYGAVVVKKLEETDYVVMGVKAGPKKIKEIEDKGLETIDEEGFYEMLKNGVPQEKLDRMAAEPAPEPPQKKQKK